LKRLAADGDDAHVGAAQLRQHGFRALGERDFEGAGDQCLVEQ
jgi:hypothetical protein